MTESKLYQSVRDAAYRRHGHIDLKTGRGLLKIAKLTTLAMYGEAGWPDMMICIMNCHTVFIELKNPNGKGVVSDAQAQRHAELRALGFPVYVSDNREECLGIIEREVKNAKSRRVQTR